MISPATTLAFSLYENKGIYALLLGSGVSRAAEIPTGWEITLDLIKRIAALERAEEQVDWVAWYTEYFKTDPTYSSLLDNLAPTQDERRSILHSYIEPTPEDFVSKRRLPTRAHHSIAKLVRDGFVRVIITTNFDRLIENALREIGVAPTVLSTVDDIKGAVPLVHSSCLIIKVHGDYLDTRIRNTEHELASYAPEMDELLDRVFDEYGLIVCGWSSDWDGALRAAITRAPNRRYPLYWAARGATSHNTNDLVSHRRGKIIPIADADSFFERLANDVLLQAQIDSAHPISAKLLVETAKKYLVQPQLTISLDDMIAREANELESFCTKFTPFLNVSWPSEKFPTWVAQFESKLEPLARIFGALGRWGSPGRFGEARAMIGHFAQTRLVNGDTKALAFRSYPSIVLAYSLGVAAVRAGRYKEVYEILTQPIKNVYDGKEKPFVQEYFPGRWEASDVAAWALLPNLQGGGSKYPMSVHLKKELRLWCVDYALPLHEFDATFERF
ncbi:MAG TPA: SIR2 family protein [Roseiarcus sp.]|nr:SIR2 family protein [Roseiarcus sp.]